MPNRATITVTAILIVLLAACGTTAAVQGRWGWAIAAAVLVPVLGHEIRRDLAERRRALRRRR
jgi:hypothetical protein